MAMATSMESKVRIAQKLPLALLNFFKKYPPPQLRNAPAKTSGTPTPTPTPAPQLLDFLKESPPLQNQTASKSLTPSEINSSLSSNTAEPPSPTTKTDSSSGLTDQKTHNPFMPFKNPRTGRWHGAAYSLRRQAELYKLARLNFVLDLMPVGEKHPYVKVQRRLDKLLKTGDGKRAAKGKMWERALRSKVDERRKAMEGMNEMVKTWKERGHGRGWTKWPR